MESNYENKDLNTFDVNGGTTDDNKNSKDNQESKKEDIVCEQNGEQENADQKEAASSKEEDYREKAEADGTQAPNVGQKEETAGEQGRNCYEASSSYQNGVYSNTVNHTASFSTSYAPPYHAPSFSGGYGYSQQTNAKTKKRYGVGVIAAVCAIGMVFAAIVGAFAGALVGRNVVGGILGSSDGGLTILRGNREINVVEVPDGAIHSDLSVAQIAALVGNSVVEITTTHVETSSFYGQYITSGAGSGVIFSQDSGYGYIVTNYHVVEGADDISVSVKHGNTHMDYVAEYIAGDMAEDIAVIKIPVSNDVKLTTAQFRNFETSPLQVGEDVVAIGNPLGQLGGTVTDGIISALDREITIEDNTMVLLQTNAAINPGNSGGGLFDTSGLLIGIVNAKQSSTGIEGLGFAIPADKVLEDITDIMELGYISGRPTLGIGVTYGTHPQYRLTGVFVMEYDSSKAAFSKYDCIVAINNEAIEGLSDYNAAIKSLKIGETVKVTVIREGKTYVDVDVTVLEDTSVE